MAKRFEITIKQDLWSLLQESKKPILMYGMGNGADKILAICEKRNIEISDFFASDGFVRGHSFHGKTVLSYSQAKEKYKSFIVLLSFASSLTEVIDNIVKISAEQELYAPDVPVFGDNIFDLDFAKKHEKELKEAYALLADDKSRDVFENIVNYKLTGKIEYLFNADSNEAETMKNLLCAEHIQSYIDLGAYNGDTIRALDKYAPQLENIIALEPDSRNYRKLCEYAQSVSDRLNIKAYNVGAWSHKDTLLFDRSGNRNSNLGGSIPMGKTVQVEVNSVDNIIKDLANEQFNKIDYVKYDVEGSEKEALIGSTETIQRFLPSLLVSVYHRSEDIFELPIMLHKISAEYSLYLRKNRYIPAWDLNLFAIKH